MQNQDKQEKFQKSCMIEIKKIKKFKKIQNNNKNKTCFVEKSY